MSEASDILKSWIAAHTAALTAIGETPEWMAESRTSIAVDFLNDDDDVFSRISVWHTGAADAEILSTISGKIETLAFLHADNLTTDFLNDWLNTYLGAKQKRL